MRWKKPTRQEKTSHQEGRENIAYLLTRAGVKMSANRALYHRRERVVTEKPSSVFLGLFRRKRRTVRKQRLLELCYGFYVTPRGQLVEYQSFDWEGTGPYKPEFRVISLDAPSHFEIEEIERSLRRRLTTQ